MYLRPGLRSFPLPAAPGVSQDDHNDTEAQPRSGGQGAGPGGGGWLRVPQPDARHWDGVGAAETGQGQGGARDNRDGGGQ